MSGEYGAGASRRPKGSVLAVAALLVGAWLIQDGGSTSAPPQPSAAQSADLGAAPGAGEPLVPVDPMGASLPVRVRIPVIGVNAQLVLLGLDPGGHLIPPPAQQPRVAGWYAGGVTPGQTGTSVLAGHVDNTAGPAVFYNLGALKKGAQVDVDRADRSTAAFTVDGVEVYPKKDFPDTRVYGAAARPELRLITCGGGYQQKTGYDGNVVVFAHLTGRRPG